MAVKTETDALSSAQLLQHIRMLAETIGPRPPGQRAEMQARSYVRSALTDAGVTETVEEIAFPAPDTPGYALIYSGLLGIVGNLLGRRLRWIGGALSFLAAFSVYQTMSGRRQPLNFITPAALSADLVVRIAPKGTVKRKVVLVGHLDTSKHRLSYSPPLKPLLRGIASAGIAIAAINGLAQLFGWRKLRRLTFTSILTALPLIALDESDEFVQGANDNASAVACLLGLAAQLKTQPLENTEVWLAFTGAEEVGGLGMHALLDKHRETLADAWFVDFELVGAGDIAYVTHHTGLTHFSAYEPDAESLAWASETARANPQLGVRGKPMRSQEEIGTLRARGFRGICLVGVGADGWLVNWRQRADRVEFIDPRSVEQAARFAWAMLKSLDERKHAR